MKTCIRHNLVEIGLCGSVDEPQPTWDVWKWCTECGMLILYDNLGAECGVFRPGEAWCDKKGVLHEVRPEGKFL